LVTYKLTGLKMAHWEGSYWDFSYILCTEW